MLNYLNLPLYFKRNAKPDSIPVVISLNGNQMNHIPLMQAVAKTQMIAKAMSEKDFNRVIELRGLSFQRNLATCLHLSKVSHSIISQIKIMKPTNFVVF